MSTIRKAARADLDAVCRIYDQIHTAEERGEAAIGWQRGVYPERETAEAALARGDLFVQEQNGEIVGTAILNQTQVDSYAGANWRYDAPDSEVMVLHTLVIDPEAKSRGLGREFAAFYEGYALAHGCRYLRIDTNARNARARRFYQKLGYAEIGVVPCTFNGIAGVQLVLLEAAAAAATNHGGRSAAPARVRAGLVRAPQPRVREFQGQLSEPAL